MIRSLACLTLPLLILSQSPALAEDIAGTDFSSGNWAGRAWADNSGAFVDCYFGVTYLDGETLSVSLMADDTLTVYLSAPNMKFNPSQSYEAVLMTEVGFPVAGPAFAPNEGFIGFTLLGIDDSISYLTQGSYLRLYGIGIDQSFDIRGLGGALVHGKECLSQQTGGGKVAANDPAKPATGDAANGEKPKLGITGPGPKPVQMSGQIGSFKRQHEPCKTGDCQ